MSIFIALILTYFAANCWFNWRVWRALKDYKITRRVICITLFFLTFSFIISMKIPSNIWPVQFLAFAGALWLAFFLYALMMLLCVDIFRLLNRAFNWLPQLKEANNPKLPVVISLSIALLSSFICLAGWINAINPTLKTTELDVYADVKKPTSVTIAALSDLHLGRLVSADRLDKIVNLIIPQNPDIVLFAGDILDDQVGLDEEAMKKSIDKLHPPMGVWGVLGNHEYHSGPIDNSLDIIDRMGIKILRDDWAVPPKNKLLLVGRDDYSSVRFTKNKRAELDEILDKIPKKKRELPMILLDHQPHNIEQAQQAGAILQLSGHTHKGQLWPINYIVDALYTISYGHGQIDKTHYWVSAGVGTWGPPVRTTARPEVLLITLNLKPIPKQH